MNKQTLILAGVLALTSFSGRAQAQTTAKAQLAADNKAALVRYESDKKLCNDETSSSSRLQCRRDAKAEYNQTTAAARARQAAAARAAPARASAAQPAAMHSASAMPACTDCGTVAAVSVTEKAGESSPLGMIAGGVGGAILGHQVGGGTGKDLATIAGAVGGAYAGKKIEENMKTHKIWTVSVNYGGTAKRHFEFSQDPGYRVGDAVRNQGKSITRQ